MLGFVFMFLFSTAVDGASVLDDQPIKYHSDQDLASNIAVPYACEAFPAKKLHQKSLEDEFVPICFDEGIELEALKKTDKAFDEDLDLGYHDYFPYDDDDYDVDGDNARTASGYVSSSSDSELDSNASVCTSNVSERRLRDLGLVPKPASPSSTDLRHASSFSKIFSSLLLFNDDDSISSEAEAGDNENSEEAQFGIDLEEHVVDGDTDHSAVKSLNRPPSLVRTEYIVSTASTANSAIFTNLEGMPDGVLFQIWEYLCDIKFKKLRFLSKYFKNITDGYLNFIYRTTMMNRAQLATVSAIEQSISFRAFLSSTMLSLYQSQPSFHNLIRQLIFSNSDASWKFLSIYDLVSNRAFSESLIFSDKFIGEKLIPGLVSSSVVDATGLFLLGEVLIASSRYSLFKSKLLPQLNRFALTLAPPPPINLMDPAKVYHSEGYLAALPPVEDGAGDPNTAAAADAVASFSGATLHVAIDLNFTRLVGYLVRLRPESLKICDRYGRPALVHLVHNLIREQRSFARKLKESLAEKDEGKEEYEEEDVIRWVEARLRRGGRFHGSKLTGNAKISLEMFFQVMKELFRAFPPTAIAEAEAEAETEAQGSDDDEDDESTVLYPEYSVDPKVLDILGLDQTYTHLTLISGKYAEKSLNLLLEIILGQQYDLLAYVGLQFGEGIRRETLFINDSLLLAGLFRAIEKNDAILTSLILGLFPDLDVNEKLRSGSSMVGFATARKCIAALKILLKDARLNPNDEGRSTPLIRAIELNSLEAFNLLLSHPKIELDITVEIRGKWLSVLDLILQHNRWDFLESFLLKCKLMAGTRLLLDPFQLLNANTIILEALERSSSAMETVLKNCLALINHLILPTIPEDE